MRALHSQRDLPVSAIDEKLRDPAFLDLHLAAIGALARIGEPRWYDSHFLRRYEAAKLYLAEVRPDALDDFITGFDPLRPSPDFEVIPVENLFDHATHDHIREIARSIPEAQIERHENAAFGRHVVHDHAVFVELQEQVQPRVEDMVGRPLEAGYNFLSLYGPSGVCDLHMDEPLSMYTLDYCIEQSHDWPIAFSNVVDWPDAEAMREWTPDTVLNDPKIRFEERSLRENNALIFAGSSQWHHRRPIPRGGFCNLLFFHYFPAGCEGLVWPHLWADHFGVPELQAFCDLVPSDERKPVR